MVAMGATGVEMVAAVKAEVAQVVAMAGSVGAALVLACLGVEEKVEAEATARVDEGWAAAEAVVMVVMVMAVMVLVVVVMALVEWGLAVAVVEKQGPSVAVELQEAVTNPIVRVLLGSCCAERNHNELTLLIGTEQSIENAMPCSRLAQLDDSSAVVTVCRGTGTWLFVSAQSSDDVNAPGLALAEVEICDASDARPLYAGQFTRGLDISAGIVRIEGAGRTSQIAPQLLPFGTGKDADWRTAATRADWSATQWAGLTLAFLLLFGLAAVMRYTRSNGVLRPGGKARHARLKNEEDAGMDGEPPASGSENDEVEARDAGSDGETEDDDDILGQRVLITFETRDGIAVQSSLSIANISSMEQLLAKVSRAGSAAGFHTTDHMSLQYVDHLTQRIEQAWYDPILKEGSDIDVVKRATQLRILLLGDVRPEQAAHADAVTSVPAEGLWPTGSPDAPLELEPIYLGEEADIEVAVSRI